MRYRTHWTIAAAAMALVACVKVGREIHFEDTRRLTPGVSTRADAEEIFGPPWGVGVDGKGKTHVVWVSAHSWLGGIGAGGKSLALIFEPDGKYIGLDTMTATGEEADLLPGVAPGPSRKPVPGAPAASVEVDNGVPHQ